jgi:hypothetical protein
MCVLAPAFSHIWLAGDAKCEQQHFSHGGEAPIDGEQI